MVERNPAVLDARPEALIQSMVRRLSRSLLLYICESSPWAPSAEQGPLVELHKINAEERAAVARLTKFLQRRRNPVPSPGAYPMAFTTMNFVSLDYLLPLLVKHQRETLAVVEEYGLGLTDAEARHEVDRTIETVRSHLKRLEALAAHPLAAVH